MNQSVELNGNKCEFSFSRSESVGIWGTCTFNMQDDLDGHFTVDVDDIEAFFDAGETELPIKLTEYEIDMLCEWIFEEANELNLWEDLQQMERDWMDEYNREDEEYL